MYPVNGTAYCAAGQYVPTEKKINIWIIKSSRLVGENSTFPLKTISELNKNRRIIIFHFFLTCNICTLQMRNFLTFCIKFLNNVNII